MKLLIVTQVVDADDSRLGFFHEWLRAFSENVEHLEVICLKKGRYDLPANVGVHSLGKELREESSSVYALRFLALVWKLRKEYDVVFVHMNVEYILLAGLVWKMLRKRVGLWYVHGTVSLRLRIAVALSNAVFTASPESMRVATKKVHVVGHGIDTDFFTPDPSGTRGSHLLSVGRLDASKHHDLIIQAAKLAGLLLRIAGEGPDRGRLEQLAQDIGANVTFLGGLTREQLRDEYRRAAHFIHASTTGSMDKVVLEAAACDANVITTTKDIYKGFPVHSVEATPEAIVEALSYARDSSDRVSIIQEKFSIQKLIPRILAILTPHT